MPGSDRTSATTLWIISVDPPRSASDAATSRAMIAERARWLPRPSVVVRLPLWSPASRPAAPRRGQGREAAREGRQETAGRGTAQDRPVDGERREPAGSRASQLALNHRSEQLHRQRAGAERDDGCAGAEHQRLEQEEPGDGAAAGAERHPHRNLLLPARRADEDQRGDVPERDEEHERRRRRDGPQDRTHARHVLIVRRGDGGVPLRRKPRRFRRARAP